MSPSSPNRTPYRICVVCTGNICRSPMGEILLRRAFDAEGLDVSVSSAGTSAEEVGKPIDPRAASALRRHGVDVDRRHRARRFEPSDWNELDLVLVATQRHGDQLARLTTGEADAKKIRLLRSFDVKAVSSNELDIDDPWYSGTPEAFDRTHSELVAAIPGIVQFVRTQQGC